LALFRRLYRDARSRSTKHKIQTTCFVKLPRFCFTKPLSSVHCSLKPSIFYRLTKSVARNFTRWRVCGLANEKPSRSAYSRHFTGTNRHFTMLYATKLIQSAAFCCIRFLSYICSKAFSIYTPPPPPSWGHFKFCNTSVAAQQPVRHLELLCLIKKCFRERKVVKPNHSKFVATSKTRELE